MQSKINLIAHRYSLHSRLDKTAEECLELSLSLMHHKERGGEIDHITEEIADVEIMLEQLEDLGIRLAKGTECEALCKHIWSTSTDEVIKNLMQLSIMLIERKNGARNGIEISFRMINLQALLNEVKKELKIGQFAVDQWKEIKVKRQMCRMREEG